MGVQVAPSSARPKLVSKDKGSTKIPIPNPGPPTPIPILVSYSSIFKEHLANPRNAGQLEDADAVAEMTNPVCGDRLRLGLRVRGGRVEAARFLAYGCPPTLACGSALAGMLEGMSVEDAARISRQDVARAAGGLPPRKGHAAALAIETLRETIARL